MRLLTRATIFSTLALTVGLAACSDSDEREARRETRGPYTVVWLSGSPYEMGRQHARLLSRELEEGLKAIDKNVLLKAMFILARQLGGDAPAMASIITFQTLLAFLVMPVIALWVFGLE